MEQAKKAGFEAIELAAAEKGELSLDSTREDAEKIVQTAKEVGIELSSLATGLFWDYSLSSSNDKVRAAGSYGVGRQEIIMKCRVKPLGQVTKVGACTKLGKD